MCVTTRKTREWMSTEMEPNIYLVPSVCERVARDFFVGPVSGSHFEHRFVSTEEGVRFAIGNALNRAQRIPSMQRVVFSASPCGSKTAPCEYRRSFDRAVVYLGSTVCQRRGDLAGPAVIRLIERSGQGSRDARGLGRRPVQ